MTRRGITWWLTKVDGEWVRVAAAEISVCAIRAGKAVLIGHVTASGRAFEAWPHPSRGSWTVHRTEHNAIRALIRKAAKERP